jgi:uncharacterized protein YkwD
MNRRGFVGGGLIAALAPGRGAGRPPVLSEEIAGYLERLQLRGVDAGGGRFLSEDEAELLILHNAFRAETGLGPLRADQELAAAARAEAGDLVDRRYFAHTSPEGFSSQHRIGLLARRFLGACGENLAMQTGAARPGPRAFLRLWRDSPGHRANMLRANFNGVGFGVAAAPGLTLACAVFGQRYAGLTVPPPLWVGDGRALAGCLDTSSRPLAGYGLQPLAGGETLGPFALDAAPPPLRGGGYALRPHAPDPGSAGRFWVVYGPVVLAST